MMSEEQLLHTLLANKSSFLEIWQEEIEKAGSWTRSMSHEEQDHAFDIYMNSSQRGLQEFLKEKLEQGLPLSYLEASNAGFMNALRLTIRDQYPLNTRGAFLEKLSQKILNNEISLAQEYENNLNHLTDRLMKQNQSLLESIDLATGQLQSPLWSILGFTAKLERNYNHVLGEDGRHWLNRISINVSEMHQYIENLTTLLLIDTRKTSYRESFLWDLIKGAEKKVKQEVDNRFFLEANFNHGLTICGDAPLLKEMFYQLFKNSALYVSEKTSPVVQIEVTNTKEELIVYVKDNGIGIPREYWELVQKPTERLKETDSPGLGIGFSLINKILEKHRGTLEFKDQEESGLIVILTFSHAIMAPANTE